MAYKLLIFLALFSSLFSIEIEDNNEIDEIIQIIELDPIDINRGSELQLLTIPYISKSDIEDILDYRKSKGKLVVEDLVRLNIVSYQEYETIKDCFKDSNSNKLLRFRSLVKRPLYKVAGEKKRKFYGNRYKNRYSILLKNEKIDIGALGEKDSYELQSNYKYNINYNADLFSIGFGNFVLKDRNGVVNEASLYNNPFEYSSNIFELKKDLSTQEFYDMKGVVIKSDLPYISFEAGVFETQFSSTLENGTIKSVKIDGIYETENSIKKNFNSKNRRVASTVSIYNRKHRVSLGFIGDNYNRKFYKSEDKIFNDYSYLLSYKNSMLKNLEGSFTALLKGDKFLGKVNLNHKSSIVTDLFIQYSNIKKATPFSNDIINLEGKNELLFGGMISTIKSKWRSWFSYTAHINSNENKQSFKQSLERKFGKVKFKITALEKIYKKREIFFNYNTKLTLSYSERKTSVGSSFQYSKSEEKLSEGIIFNSYIKNRLGKYFDIKFGLVNFYSTRGKHLFYNSGSYEGKSNSLTSLSGSGYIGYGKIVYNYWGFKISLGYYNQASSSGVIGSGNNEINGNKDRLSLGIDYIWKEK
ncbi:MAG: hypothetical protein CR982_07760 [Candidatus Cloacimonadota bacterium]|nr:MAG: hypothetical protein CR982_07760 [Candidatus Cloacimonadota bacterium]PIE78249.1 MAG: hypothetical protein CSA15_08780 [Candidatus Delongbacteria bacterium]